MPSSKVKPSLCRRLVPGPLPFGSPLRMSLVKILIDDDLPSGEATLDVDLEFLAEFFLELVLEAAFELFLEDFFEPVLEAALDAALDDLAEGSCGMF